jgi:hypothetical protein
MPREPVPPRLQSADIKLAADLTRGQPRYPCRDPQERTEFTDADAGDSWKIPAVGVTILKVRLGTRSIHATGTATRLSVRALGLYGRIKIVHEVHE